MNTMTAIKRGSYRIGELHEFEAEGQGFAYLVGAGAIFALDEGARSVIARLRNEDLSHEELIEA
jgi:uncharacterized protein